MFTFGQQTFVVGPMMMLIEVTTECNLEELFSYLLLARVDMNGLSAFAKLLEKKYAQGHPELL